MIKKIKTFILVMTLVIPIQCIFAKDILIIGATPWDDNIKCISGLVIEGPNAVHFVDRYLRDYTGALPDNFHHLDLNDEGMYDAGKFSDFANTHPGRFDKIIIDWGTYHHIRRNETWKDFSTILKSGGILIVPVTHMELGIRTYEIKSSEKAEELVRNKALGNWFHEIKIRSFDEINQEKDPDLVLLTYKRIETNGLSPFDCILSMKPAIIFATK